MIELLFVLGLVAIVSGVAIPQLAGSLDASRAYGAARFVSSRIIQARLLAVRRSTAVALRFDQDARGYRITMFVDGNRNGVRNADIALQIDRPLDQPVRLFELFPGADLGLIVGGRSDNPVQLGGTTLLSFSPGGTATSGSVYVRGRDGSQFAIRVLGATGRTRLLRYDERHQQWTERD